MGLKEVAQFRKQILGMTPAALLRVIKEKFDLGHNDAEFEEDMMGGLYTAVSERPSIAGAICPELARSGDYRLVHIFMDLLHDLWRYDKKLMVTLLKEVQGSKNNELLRLVSEELDFYVGKEGRRKDQKFADFLITSKLHTPRR